tara:strand:+ start:142 stop:1041 length:900 start_codon:yes stop_codon:yes gene_type:complete
MAMDQIPEHYTTEFNTNWLHLSQQTTKRFDGCAMLDTIRGKEKRYNQLDQSTMRQITARNEPTVASEIDTELRWCRPKFYEKTTLLDEWDDQLLGDVVLPTSHISQSHNMAYSRTCDQVLIDGLEGGAITGEDGTTTTTVPSTQEVVVNLSGSSEGLTVGKMIEAKSILGKNEIYEAQNPMDALIGAVTQAQLDDLLAITQITSVDYNGVKALVEGKVDTFMGFLFKRSELLTLVAATDVRTAIFYAKSGVILADGQTSTKLSVRDDLSESLQIRTKASIGSTRLEEKKIVLVYCDESP